MNSNGDKESRLDLLMKMHLTTKTDINSSMKIFWKQLEMCVERTCVTRQYVMYSNQNDAFELINNNDFCPT